MTRVVKRKSPQGVSMTERELSASIVHAARECGWLVNRPWLSKFSPAGFPDLFMVKDGHALALELKSERGKVSEPQQEWLDALARVPGVVARVVYPKDIEEAYKLLLPQQEEKP